MVAARPDEKVMTWFEDQPESSLYLSVITWGEILKGIYPLPAGKRRVKLETWLADELFPLFTGRILDIDQKLIETWARMISEFKKRGVARPLLDSLIEATAVEHHLILVTRNERNFTDASVSVLNPWT